MKKNMVIIMFVFTTLLHGMEEEKNDLMFLIDNTMIRLTRGCIYDFDGKVDVMVVGENEQRILKDSNVVISYKVGSVGCVRSNKVYIKNKGTHSPQDFDDIYIRQWHDAPTKHMHCKVITVVEPWIVQGKYKEYSDIEAVIEAKKDLGLCYRNVLDDGSKEETRIAIPALGIGFLKKDRAAVAVTAILEYIGQHKQHPYNLIHLVLNKWSVFDLYKELLEKYVVEQK